MHTLTLNKREFNGKVAPEWATAVAQFNHCWYWEESLGQENGMRFQNTEGSMVVTYNNSCRKGCDASYLLPPIEEEQLPPAPNSVYYPDMYNLMTGKAAVGGTQGVSARRSPYLEDAISISVAGSKWSRLDADAALQLAHDLRRMAMDIKRKQKQEQA